MIIIRFIGDKKYCVGPFTNKYSAQAFIAENDRGGEEFSIEDLVDPAEEMFGMRIEKRVGDSLHDIAYEQRRDDEG